MVHVRAQLSLADINRLKYMNAMKRRAGKSGAAVDFRKKYLREGYKMTFFIERITSGNRFSYMRFNDCEFNCIFGATAPNADGHENFAQLRQDLSDALVNSVKNDQTLVQMGSWLFEGEQFQKYMRPIAAYLIAHQIDYKFLPQDPFIRCFSKYPDMFRQLLTAINQQHVVMIGPEYMKNELKIVRWQHFITVPELNCYNESMRIIDEVEKYIVNHQDTPVMFLFSASMGSNVMINTLTKKYAGHHWFLNVGSIWDNFCSDKRQRRLYMRKERAKWLATYNDLLKTTVL